MDACIMFLTNVRAIQLASSSALVGTKGHRSQGVAAAPPPQPTCHLDRFLPSRHSLPTGQKNQYYVVTSNKQANNE
jgi:hypothetical protein